MTVPFHLWSFYCMPALSASRVSKIRSNSHKIKPYPWGLTDSITEWLRAYSLGSDCPGSWSQEEGMAGNSLKKKKKTFSLHNHFPIQLCFLIEIIYWVQDQMKRISRTPEIQNIPYQYICGTENKEGHYMKPGSLRLVKWQCSVARKSLTWSLHH